MKDLKNSIPKTELCGKQVGIWYLGQEGFLFKNKDSYLAVDPYLSDYVDRNCCEYVQWKRLYEPPAAPKDLAFVNVVLCTHSHYDHADPDTLSVIAENNPNTKFVIPAACVNTVLKYGITRENVIPAVAFEEIETDGFKIIPIPSAHEGLNTDENGNYCEVGYIIKANTQTFFHAGDMCMYDGLIESLKTFDVDIAFLPINGRDYFRNRADIIGNFNCEEAVLLAKEIGAEMLVPMHHDLYEVNSASVESFVGAIKKYDRFRRYHVFAPGELYVSV